MAPGRVLALVVDPGRVAAPVHPPLVGVPVRVGAPAVVSTGAAVPPRCRVHETAAFARRLGVRRRGAMLVVRLRAALPVGVRMAAAVQVVASAAAAKTGGGNGPMRAAALAVRPRAALVAAQGMSVGPHVRLGHVTVASVVLV